jgi:hypothetical protein
MLRVMTVHIIFGTMQQDLLGVGGDASALQVVFCYIEDL